jgi:hypothetical protein
MSVYLPPILSVFLLCLSVCQSSFVLNLPPFCVCLSDFYVFCLPSMSFCLSPISVFQSPMSVCLSTIFCISYLPAKCLSFCFICHMSYVCLSALHTFFRPNISICLSHMAVSLPPTSVCLLPMSAFNASLLACFVCLFAYYSSTAV